MSESWPAGDALIASAWIWLAKRYEHLREPKPPISGPEWEQMEADIEAAYSIGQMEALRQAVRRYCRFALDQWRAHVREVA